MWFCAIPSFRGSQRSRDTASILEEVRSLQAQEIVLVAQDLASYGVDRPDELGAGSIVPLVKAVAAEVDRVRLLYLYPSDLSDELIDVILGTDVPYFDLSLQHVSKPLLRRMRRWGDGDRFLQRISDIRAAQPDATMRSNFIVGYLGETEDDHAALVDFVEKPTLTGGILCVQSRGWHVRLRLDGQVDASLMNERLAELTELQDAITAQGDALIGEMVTVLIDEPGIGRSHREAPEIDGVVHVDAALQAGGFAEVVIEEAWGPDLVAVGGVMPDGDEEIRYAGRPQCTSDMGKRNHCRTTRAVACDVSCYPRPPAGCMAGLFAVVRTEPQRWY